ncbi:MAG: glycosyltransferase, partial [Deltaproteobacteria bacterium]|nr:glycosyltransferase [Deltaproteobacteria bacterium]
ANRSLGFFNTFHITQTLFQHAALRAVRRLTPKPDAVYGHFLYSGGAAAVWCARKMGLPSFAAVGEGVFWTVRELGWERARRDFRDVTGIIAVSSLLKRQLLAQIPLSEEQVGVFPNAVDRTLFYPRDRQEMRRKLELPADTFLVAYVGNFLHEKGAARVVEAVSGLAGVGCLLAGSGPLSPSGRNILYCGRMPHESIPEMLSAADVFVLPTLIEGSCNAIVEAMACGLPIITSDGEFNDDLVDDSMALRIDPLDISAIRQAIITLRDDRGRREAMAGAALARSERFDINRRAESICSFMAGRIEAEKSDARHDASP